MPTKKLLLGSAIFLAVMNSHAQNTAKAENKTAVTPVENIKLNGVSVPLNLKGTAKGAAVGGKVEQVQRRLNILALPKDLVSGIELDITELDLGGILRISDLKTENIKYLLSGSNPVARMAVPRAAKEAAAAEGKKK